jgi:hypothetical protein
MDGIESEGIDEMGQHKTPQSIAMIQAIESIGFSLGYRVEREWGIPGTLPNPEQIDLAFFIDENSVQPVFAIEIDSTDGPASMNNPLKIFGKPTNNWVKPLFVFQLFLDATEIDRRRMNAEGAFCTQNYRTYNFKQDRQVFLTDLLDRNRSVKSEIDLISFSRALDDDVWHSIDRYALFNYASQYTQANIADYAAITLSTTHLRQVLTRAVISDEFDTLSGGELSYFGTIFTWPLIYALRAHYAPEKANETFKLFQKWQYDPDCIILNPEHLMLGLSQDFDFTIVKLEPPVYCLIALLFQREREAAKYFCEQLLARILKSSLNSEWERYGLLWCSIACVKINENEIAQIAIDRINSLGGIPHVVLSQMPSPGYSEEDVDDEASWEFVLNSSDSSPISLKLLQEAQKMIQAEDSLPDELVSEFLVNDDVLSDLNQRILSLKIS